MSRRILPLLVLAVGLLAAFAVPAVPGNESRYEVYGIRFAVIVGIPAPTFIAGADPARKINAPVMVWLLKGPDGRNILVDSGFYRKKFFTQWTIKDFVSPAKALGRVGLEPHQITDIIVTHIHWDHVGGVELFPKARVWIQKDEFLYYAGEAWHSETTHGGIDPEDVLALVKLNTKGRVRFVNGDNQGILPGVTCYTGGRHTYASQYVGVNTKAGTVVIASDNLYLYENLEKRKPIGLTLDPESNRRAQDRMKQIASSPRLIIPGHDPALFRKFPETTDGVIKIE